MFTSEMIHAPSNSKTNSMKCSILYKIYPRPQSYFLHSAPRCMNVVVYVMCVPLCQLAAQSIFLCNKSFLDKLSLSLQICLDLSHWGDLKTKLITFLPPARALLLGTAEKEIICVPAPSRSMTPRLKN